MRSLRLVLLVFFAALAEPSFAVQPDELMKDPALEVAGAGAVGGASLHGLSEPVD